MRYSLTAHGREVGCPRLGFLDEPCGVTSKRRVDCFNGRKHLQPTKGPVAKDHNTPTRGGTSESVIPTRFVKTSQAQKKKKEGHTMQGFGQI